MQYHNVQAINSIEFDGFKYDTCPYSLWAYSDTLLPRLRKRCLSDFVRAYRNTPKHKDPIPIGFPSPNIEWRRLPHLRANRTPRHIHNRAAFAAVRGRIPIRP